MEKASAREISLQKISCIHIFQELMPKKKIESSKDFTSITYWLLHWLKITFEFLSDNFQIKGYKNTTRQPQVSKVFYLPSFHQL